MQKLIASLPSITVTALNGFMCWGINQLWSKSDLNLPTNRFLVFTVVSVILIGLLSSQSTNSDSPNERENLPWIVGLVPMIGSGVLFALLKTSYLPANFIQYVGLASLFLFVTGTICPVLIVEFNFALGIKSAVFTRVNRAKDPRQVLLKVMKTEVAKRLQDSLHDQTKIPLPTKDKPEPVNQPQNLKVSKPQSKPKWNLWSFLGKTQTEVPETEKVINIFNRSDIAGRLLILGEPGSGKTTTLLELAEDLLALAEEPGYQIIPFLFELSNWKDDKLSIADWLAADLKARFNIPETETKNWMETGKLLPLLDGLDELGLTRQVQCISKIDQCLQAHPDLQVAVCCRLKEYQTGEVNFEKLCWAICIQPLTDAQIKNYLQDLNRSDLWSSIQTDPEGLLKLARLPLLLHLIPVAYPAGYLQPNLGRQHPNQQYLEETRNQLLAAYIDRQLEQSHSRYSAKDTKRWLQWLARQLKERNQTEFLLEKMQPDLLGSFKYKLLYRLIFGLIFGIILGLIFWQIGGMIIVGLTTGLAFGLMSGLMLININPNAALNLNTKRFTNNLIVLLIAGLILSLIIGELISGLISGLRLGLSFGMTFGLIGLTFGLFNGLIGLIFGLIGLSLWLSFELIKDSEIRVRNKPNQEIIESAKNAGIFTLVVYLLVTLFRVLLIWSNTVPWSFVFPGSFDWAIMPILGGGGIPVIQHYTLRFLLWCSGATPLNYVDFLNYAAERRLIQQVGGRYRFIHDLLREYLAGVQP